MTEINWKRVHNADMPPDWRETYWRVALNALPTKAFLYRIDRSRNDKCSTCLESEDKGHLFYDCAYAKYQWIWFAKLFKTYATRDNVINHKNFKVCNSYMFNWGISLIKRKLWVFRCERIYDKKIRPPAVIKVHIIKNIELKLNNDKKYMDAIRFNRLYEGTKDVIWKEQDGEIELIF